MKSKINQKRLPKFMRFYFVFFHVLLLGFIGLLFFGYYFKNSKLNILKRYVDFFIYFNQEKSELQNIVGQVKKLNILSLQKDVSIYKENQTRDFITFSIDRIQKLEKKLVDIANDIGDKEISDYYLK